MPQYRAPVEESLFLLFDVLGVGRADNNCFVDGIAEDEAVAVLKGAASFAEGVLAPLNAVGHTQGCKWHPDGTVTTPQGFREGYRAFVDGGWNGLAVPAKVGGSGLPYVLATAAEEYFNAANQALTLYATWGLAAAMLLDDPEADSLRRDYLPQLVSGEWTGTMALTEPHCGTDVGLLKTKAVRQSDGSYRLTGTKIFNSGGEHDLTENIVHFVLARIVDAPAGTRGISLFLVPKRLAAPDGSAGERNNVSCASIEHKMGQNGVATCVLNFEEATGWLIGEPNKGLQRMFALLNHTRRTFGVIATGGAWAAYEWAAAYVKERLQGRAPAGPTAPDCAADPLIMQPDVRRVLLTIRAHLEPARCLVLWLALQLDVAERSNSRERRALASERVALLTPVAKAFLSDKAFDCVVQAQQMFGGHGYIVEMGLEQYVRELRLVMIAEGANGVQAMDLVGRKIQQGDGTNIGRFISDTEAAIAGLPVDADWFGRAMISAVRDLRIATRDIRSLSREAAAACGYEYMKLLGLVTLGHMWGLILAGMDAPARWHTPEQLSLKTAAARWFSEHLLPETSACLARIGCDTREMMNLPTDAF